MDSAPFHVSLKSLNYSESLILCPAMLKLPGAFSARGLMMRLEEPSLQQHYITILPYGPLLRSTAKYSSTKEASAAAWVLEPVHFGIFIGFGQYHDGYNGVVNPIAVEVHSVKEEDTRSREYVSSLKHSGQISDFPMLIVDDVRH